MNLITQTRAKYAVETLVGEVLTDNHLYNPMTQILTVEGGIVDTDKETITFTYSLRERPSEPDEYESDPRD
jgi:hypothetical protein